MIANFLFGINKENKFCFFTELAEVKNAHIRTKKSLKILEIERKASVGNNYTKEYFRELKRLATKELKSKDELEKEIKELKIKHDKFYSSKEYAKALENKIIELNNENNELLNIIKHTNDNYIEIVEQAKQDSIERLEKAKLMKEELNKEKEMLYDMYSTADNIMRDEITKDRFMADKVNDRFASLSKSTFRDTLYKYAILHPITSEYKKRNSKSKNKKSA